MRDSDYLLHMGALERATQLHEENHDFIERVDVRNGSIHVVPSDDFVPEEHDDALEMWLEDRVSDIPFTFSEWWYDRSIGERVAVATSYWITGGQLSKEQLEQYDDYLDDMEAKVSV